jgi:NADPH:quinone reductase-like Zn-dependent oxidoreductase
VGSVTAAGAGVDDTLVGRRVAAMTKTGGWATHALLKAVDVVPVPADLDPGEVETLVVSGLTAYQMLHRRAKVRAGQTVLIHGANGGVGTTLAQLALHAGARVIGTSSPRHHAALRGIGVVPVDYNDPDLAARVRDLAPAGVDAVFDHIGGKSIARSWSLLAKGGTLVSYLDDYVSFFLGSRFTGEFRGFLISSPPWWLMSIAWIVTGTLIAAASIALSRRLTGWRQWGVEPASADPRDLSALLVGPIV